MIEIKQASRDDLAVLKLFNAEDSYFETCFSQDKTILIVLIDDASVGYGLINWSPRYSLYKKLDIPEIQDIFISPEFRQKGAATALVAYCEKAINNNNCKYVGVSVAMNKDAGNAQRLYAKLGYIPDGCGVTHDRQPVKAGQRYAIDDDLCLMMVKELS